MQLKTKGIPRLITAPIVAPVTRKRENTDEGKILISEVTPADDMDLSTFKAVLTGSSADREFDLPSVSAIPSFDHLSDGDIVVVHTDGTVNTLYRINSLHNFLLFTERCNSNCLMCSQPPRNRNDVDYLYYLYRELIPLIPKDCFELGITGGEPTLMGKYFFELLAMLRHHLPNTELHCLTNGRSFAWPNMTEKLKDVYNTRLMLGIPLYSDYAPQHDYIVQAKDAFNQTMLGLYHLAAINQRIEIRVVLHQQTIPRLTKLAKFIYRNLPFVEHIAFMGLEYQGYTPHNIRQLWINPAEYMAPLSEAAHYLSDQGLNVSIYNSQLCMMPENLWQFSKKSISDWKNVYPQECEACTKLEECGGLFASAHTQHKHLIRPFLTYS